MVIRGPHHETGASRFFNALVTTSADSVPGDSHAVLIVTVVGDERATTSARAWASRCGAAMTLATVW